MKKKTYRSKVPNYYRTKKPKYQGTRLPDPTKIIAGELKKSSHTRIRIMEAAIDCLATLGYAGTTTTVVATKAGLTRPAMLYHFPSRIELIQATAHYVMRKRIEGYYAATAGHVLDERYFPSVIDQIWRQLHEKDFRASAELLMAARTDSELAAVFTPALLEFDRSRREAATSMFPDEIVKASWFDLWRDVARFLLEGFAQQESLSFNAEKRTAHIVEFVKALIVEPAGRLLLERVTSKYK